ncbi:MAG: hypothetical protein AB7N76_15865 [Planctomycetota bacterium]
MPELVHDCGKKVRFPSGTEGRRGKCPHCGGAVTVPAGDGGAPLQRRIHLDPPPDWESYKAYLEDRAGPPRVMVMPQRLMLQAEADERWERQADARPSRFHCPVCRTRINVDQVICTKCGLDFRSGEVLGQNQRLNEKGLKYLADIPWLVEARRTGESSGQTDDDDDGDDLRSKAPRPRKKRSSTRSSKRLR